MEYLTDDDDAPFKPTPRYKPHDNFDELQNEGHEMMTEDFGDSKFADRKPEKELEL